jgi:hypothetical protein
MSALLSQDLPPVSGVQCPQRYCQCLREPQSVSPCMPPPSLTLFPLQPIRMPFLGTFKTRPEKFNLRLRCLNSRPRLLLKRVQDIYATSEPNGIYRPICVASMIGNDFQCAGAAEACKRFCVCMLATLLRFVQGISNKPFDLVGKLLEVSLRASDPNDGFELRRLTHAFYA